MIMYIIRAIIPSAMGWIGCEIYHRWIERWIEESDRK